jgi:hypothetical protein
VATYQFLGQDIVAPFRVNSNEPVFAADSVSLKHRRLAQGSQRWELEFGVIMQDSASFFSDMVSSFDSEVTMTMPQLNIRGETISSGTCTTAVITGSTSPVGSTLINLSSANGTISKGRFVKFANHNKIYLVTGEYSGSGNLSIYPKLVQSVPVATALLYLDSHAITFRGFRDVTNINGITYTDGVLSEAGTINLIEAL